MWTVSHQGLNFGHTYSYIIHFLEGYREGDVESKKTVEGLMKWWNK